MVVIHNKDTMTRLVVKIMVVVHTCMHYNNIAKANQSFSESSEYWMYIIIISHNTVKH